MPVKELVLCGKLKFSKMWRVRNQFMYSYSGESEIRYGNAKLAISANMLLSLPMLLRN